MKKYWYDVYDRGLDTVAVWTCCAPTFPVGELNLAAHAADVNLVSALLPPLAGAEDVLDTARDSRDIVAATLRDLCVRGCRLIASTVPAGDPMADKVQAVYAVRSQTFRALQDKTVKLITAWQAMNEHRAALNPAQPALLVGTTTVSEVQSLLGNYAQLLDNVSKKEAPVKTKKGLFHLAANRVDQNNKRWYKAWLGQFAAGSVERAALSQIDTGPTQPLPGAGVFLHEAILPNQTVKLEYGAARATSFTLYHKAPNAAAFIVLADGLTVNLFEHAASSPGAHTYKVVGRNSRGTGPESALLVVNVPQAAAA